MTEGMLKILVIGAHPDDADVRCGGLALKYIAQGHEVKFLSATNGDTGHHEIGGVELARRWEPDLIICDVVMPGIDGYEVLKTLREEKGTQNIPFIFLTAKTERADMRQGMRLGADDYLTKPFTSAELIEAINAARKRALVATDVPSGLDCDSGAPSNATIKANLTITFVASKTGFTVASAAPYVGRVEVADIGAPRQLVAEIVEKGKL